jgi:enediyne biosynthesis protein CalE5
MTSRIPPRDAVARHAADRGDGQDEPDEMEAGRSLYARHLNQWLLGALALAPGKTVLELGAGAGDFALRLAERVRPGGVVLCTDRRAASVAQAQAVARAAHAPEIDARVMDMLDLPLPDSHVDAAICRWGLMFAVPTGKAVAEMCRVLRPGGRLALGTWADPERNPWATLADRALRQLGWVPPDRQAPGEMLSLGDATHLRALLMDAGFVSVATAELPVRWTYTSQQAYWCTDVCWRDGPMERFLSGLDAGDVSRVRAHVFQGLERYRKPDGGYELPGLALCARAQRPS